VETKEKNLEQISEAKLLLHLDSLRFREECQGLLRGREAKISALNSKLYLLNESDFEAGVSFFKTFAQSKLETKEKNSKKSDNETRSQQEVSQILKKTA
jgi:hypothetical protein